jgi:hypothetical protein
MLASQRFELRPPINGAAKMRSDDRSTDNKTDGERLEDPGGHDERKEATKDQVLFIDTLDAQNFHPLSVLIAFSSALRWSGCCAVASRSSYV